MNKLLLTGIALFFTFILAVSSSDRAMKLLYPLRENNPVLRSDNYFFGDLFGMSFIREFKVKNDFVSSEVDPRKCDRPRTIHLCIAGDSYLGEFYVKGPDPFCGVRELDYLNLGSTEHTTVDLHTGETNFMLIETVERNLRSFVDPRRVSDRFLINQSSARRGVLRSFNTFLRKNIFNKNIDQNLRFNLFDYQIFTPVRELKAALNLHIFERTPADVYVPPDAMYLLYQQTVDASSPHSSFSEVGDESIDSIVNSLNGLYDHYRKAGFDEVYFSAIPNPATILYPTLGTYNRLIPRIIGHPRLKMRSFDVSGLFSSADCQIYFTSDSHWNISGFHLWLNTFNSVLAEYAEVPEGAE